MKYLIASDIHGSAYWTERLVAAIESEQPDRIVLLGDLLYHGPRNNLPDAYDPKGVIALLNGVKNDLKHTTGVLSMARAMDPNSAGSQFFIMHMDAPHLDKQYAAFGKVTEGMDVVDAIARTPRSMFNDKPTHEQKMKTVTVETFGEEYAEPETC